MSFAEALPPINQEFYPTPLFPGIDLGKGRERLIQGAKNVFGFIKVKFKDTLHIASENRYLALAASGVMLRVVASTVSNGDLHTVDMLSKTAFSTGLFVDRALIPLAEKFSGVELDKHPLLSKVRGVLRDLTAVSGGMALGGMIEGAFHPATVVFADGPQQTNHQNDIYQSTPGQHPDSEFQKFLTSDKRIFHNGGIVYPNGSVLYESSGNILPSEHLQSNLPSQEWHLDPTIREPEFMESPQPVVDHFKYPENLTGYVPMQRPLGLEHSDVTQVIESTKAGLVIEVSQVSIDAQWSGIVENGESKIHHLMDNLGIKGEVDHDAYLRSLQRGIKAFESGNLLDDSPIGRLFHVSNGTGSLESIQNDPRFITELQQQRILIP